MEGKLIPKGILDPYKEYWFFYPIEINSIQYEEIGGRFVLTVQINDSSHQRVTERTNSASSRTEHNHETIMKLMEGYR